MYILFYINCYKFKCIKLVIRIRNRVCEGEICESGIKFPLLEMTALKKSAFGLTRCRINVG